ncbi:MAG TPA: histidinol-phosphatase HisJ family protein, partial [Clostridia bacterium]|nr:histidinol-phosphatase HisJ family protein [Clostridia bacterium]
MLDFHIHSAFSLDADSSMDEYCEAAVALGIGEIAFTDHLDINYPHPEFETVLDLNLYKAAIERVRKKYPNIEIRLGIEAGYKEDAVEATAKVIEILKPDFVINSVHVVNGCDPFFIEYFNNKTRKQAYDDYMKVLQDSLDVPYPYSVIGHIGYVAKRSPYPYPAIQLVDYKPILDNLLYRIIYTG